MFLKLPVRILLSLVFVITCASAIAQPNLPDIIGVSDKGINVLSWNCQYDGIKSIAVQRSSDSTYNFITVGYVKNLKKGLQAFIDGHPVAGNNWYKLYIVFGSDLTWYSNRIKLHVDSATLKTAGVLPPNDSLQKLAAKVKIDTVSNVSQSTGPGRVGDPAKRGGNIVVAIDSTQALPNMPKLTITIPEPAEVNEYSYVKSQYVFTNPFTGHVNLELPDYKSNLFAVKFYNDKGRQILDIPLITEPILIIDKRNFQRKGLYKFELSKDKKKWETGYITIY